MSPVKVCDKCLAPYCGVPSKCLRGVKECLNPKCKELDRVDYSLIGYRFIKVTDKEEVKNILEQVENWDLH